VTVPAPAGDAKQMAQRIALPNSLRIALPNSLKRMVMTSPEPAM
jgi:hypothetical protein